MTTDHLQAYVMLSAMNREDTFRALKSVYPEMQDWQFESAWERRATPEASREVHSAFWTLTTAIILLYLLVCGALAVRAQTPKPNPDRWAYSPRISEEVLVPSGTEMLLENLEKRVAALEKVATIEHGGKIAIPLNTGIDPKQATEKKEKPTGKMLSHDQKYDLQAANSPGLIAAFQESPKSKDKEYLASYSVPKHSANLREVMDWNGGYHLVFNTEPNSGWRCRIIDHFEAGEGEMNFTLNCGVTPSKVHKEPR